MLYKEDESSEFSVLTKDLCKIKKEKSIISAIFELYYQLYHEKSTEENSLFSQKVVESIESGLWCLQMLTLLWLPNLPIANWNKNKEIWEIIEYSRLDNISSEMNASIDFLYLSIALTLTLFLKIAILVFITYYSFNLPRLVFTLFKWIYNLWAMVIFIPSMVIFSIFLKHNFLHQKYVSEYRNNNDADNFEISIGWQIVIIFAMVINFFLILFYTELSGELRHFANQKIIKSRAHSKIDVHRSIFVYFSAIIYVFFDEDSIIYFQIIEMIISMLIIIEIIMLLPYFSYFCNLILFLQFFTVAFISFAFVIGHWLDNSLFIILMAIFVWPLLILFAIQAVWKYQKNINPKISSGLIGIRSKYQLEKSLRYSLCENDVENKNQIIYLFENFFIENILLRDKLQAIWIANYCLFTLEDESLAKFKLCKSKKISEWNLETNFQEYLCNRNIKTSSHSDSSMFIEYFQKLIMIKKKDFKLCVNLLRFWEEIVSYKPNLKILTKSLSWVDKKILFLDNQYTELTAKFYSKEFLSLYTSFSKDILYDREKSYFLENKLKSIDLSIISSYSKTFSCFNDTNGILVISAEDDSFGRILFSNTTAQKITKSSLMTINECNILDFIPSYYCEKLREELHNILHYSPSGEIDLSECLFLNLPTNFIIECIGKVFITSIDKHYIFILVFKQKETNNQIATISENGEICGHSENFPKAVRMNSERLIGFNIKKLFSEKEFDLQWSTPYYLQNCENETILIFSYFQFYKLKVYYALLMNDFEEIQKWKNNTSNSQEENFALNRQLSLSLPKFEENNRFIRKNFYQEENLETTDKNLSPTIINDTTDADCNLIENKDEDKYQTSENPRSQNIFQQALMSTKSINILHAAFIISIIAVLSTNISVLFFAVSNINFIRNMDLPIVIGKIEKGMQNIAASAQILWLFGANTDDLSKLFLYEASTFMIDFLTGLKSIYSEITSDLEKWNYCSGQHIFNDESINIWNVNKKSRTNLFDMVIAFIQLGNELLIKFNQSEDISNEASFLIINGYGEAFRHCNDSLHEVIECQGLIMSDFRAEMEFLLVLGICVLAVCALAMIPFGYSAVKYESNLWNNLRKKVYDNYSELKQALLERIKITHFQPEILLNEQIVTKKTFYFKNYWKYIWRIAVYGVIAVLFSLISIFYLYEKCTDYLTYRPEVMKELIYQQILQNSLVIWTMNSQFDIWGLPLVYWFPNQYPFKTSITEFEEMMPKLGHSKLVLRNPKYSPILSTKFKTMLYEHTYNSTGNYFKYGQYTAQEIVKLDSYMFAYVDEKALNLLTWIWYIVMLSNNYDDLIDEIDQYSQSVIENQMKIMIATFIVFAVISIFIYFALYFVFFKKEKLHLQRIRLMIKIVPP